MSPSSATAAFTATQVFAGRPSLRTSLFVALMNVRVVAITASELQESHAKSMFDALAKWTGALAALRG